MPVDLSNIALFEGVDAVDLRALAAHAALRSYPKNAIIISEGDVSDSLHVVLSGKVKIYLGDESGKELILDLKGPGSYFGEMVLDEGGHTGSMDIEIDSSRVSTGNLTVDSWLKSDTFFDVERHPRIVFRSRNFVPGRERPFRAEGELTLLGITRPVILNVERFGCTMRPPTTRKTCGADMSTLISRAAFGMTGYAAIIGDEVRLEIQFEAVAEEATAPAR